MQAATQVMGMLRETRQRWQTLQMNWLRMEKRLPVFFFSIWGLEVRLSFRFLG